MLRAMLDRLLVDAGLKCPGCGAWTPDAPWLLAGMGGAFTLGTVLAIRIAAWR